MVSTRYNEIPGATGFDFSAFIEELIGVNAHSNPPVIEFTISRNPIERYILWYHRYRSKIVQNSLNSFTHYLALRRDHLHTIYTGVFGAQRCRLGPKTEIYHAEDNGARKAARLLAKRHGIQHAKPLTDYGPAIFRCPTNLPPEDKVIDTQALDFLANYYALDYEALNYSGDVESDLGRLGILVVDAPPENAPTRTVLPCNVKDTDSTFDDKNVLVLPFSNRDLGRIQGGPKGVPEAYLPGTYSVRNALPPNEKQHFERKSIIDIPFLDTAGEQGEEEPGTFIFGGFLPRHFGHFVTDHIHSLVAASMQQKKFPILFLPQPRLSGRYPSRITDLESFHQDALTHFGIEQSRIALVSQALKIQNLIVPRPFSASGDPNPLQQDYLDYLNYCADRVLSKAESSDRRQQPKKIYVSRTRLIDGLSGAVAGEKAIEQIFQRHGFHILYPEEVSFQEQLIHYLSADHLVFAEGSAIHTLELLGNISADVTIILRRPGFESYFSRTLQRRTASLSFFRPIGPPINFFIRNGTKDPLPSRGLSFVDMNKWSRFLLDRFDIALTQNDRAEMITQEKRQLKAFRQLDEKAKGLHRVQEDDVIQQLRSYRPDYL